MPTTRQTTSPNRAILPTPIQMAAPTTFSPPHRVSVLPRATNARDSPSGLGSLPFGASVPPMLSALMRKSKKTPSSRVGGRKQRSRRRRMRSSKPKWHKRRQSPNPSRRNGLSRIARAIVSSATFLIQIRSMIATRIRSTLTPLPFVSLASRRKSSTKITDGGDLARLRSASCSLSGSSTRPGQ
jgi:hypothetical protein